MRVSVFVFPLTLFLLVCPVVSRESHSSAVAEILHIHELDRAAHLRGDATDLASRVAPEKVSVVDGKVVRETREELRQHFVKYFAVAKHKAWDDVESPIVRVSPDGKMAWAIYRVRSQYIEAKADGTEVPGEFVCAWISTYERIQGKWLATSVTSTFEPSH